MPVKQLSAADNGIYRRPTKLRSAILGIRPQPFHSLVTYYFPGTGFYRNLVQQHSRIDEWSSREHSTIEVDATCIVAAEEHCTLQVRIVKWIRLFGHAIESLLVHDRKRNAQGYVLSAVLDFVILIDCKTHKTQYAA